MHIDNLNSINFRGIYRIPNTPQNCMEINKYVEPMYKMVKHKEVLQFVGKNPFRLNLQNLMESVAKNQNSSIDWLKMNAEYHGADFSNAMDDVINIIVGEKDLEMFLEYLKKRKEKKFGIIERLKTAFVSPKSYSDKPSHLRPIFMALDLINEETKCFEEFYGSKIINVKTPEELIQKMLCEKC